MPVSDNAKEMLSLSAMVVAAYVQHNNVLAGAGGCDQEVDFR